MKRWSFLILVLTFALSGTGCISEINAGYATQAVANLAAAATTDNADLQQMAMKMREEGDSQARVAAANNAYARRLNGLMAKHGSVNGIPLNYKVYLTRDVNANASADGSIRVYSGLMDLMTDDELRYVLGHEIGHVANGDTLRAMRTAYTASAARYGLSALNPTVANLSDSFLGDLLEGVVNAQFSQSQELAADEYALNFMRQNAYNVQGAASALRKLEQLSSGGGGLLASHPAPGERAARMEQAIHNQ